ncbi:nuclear factor interleukin-3-regulated protein-like [Mercenaria mercenaria]|uniref:nuclear factor interleukin-3-regulated protein-like n=1 Tax=Mercenaria mercenaria TaxID=6596 RepID=UPI00234EB080|nr:nuclear factor interleukin-3-regulated protein-like [Mercenaria mercenaria]
MDRDIHSKSVLTFTFHSTYDDIYPMVSTIPTCVVNPSKATKECTSYDNVSALAQHIPKRRQKEFVPENRKDNGYWEKRRKNNEAGKKSREKKIINTLALENTMMELTRENIRLKNELMLIKRKFGVSFGKAFTGDEAGIQRREKHPQLHPIDLRICKSR